MALANRLAGQNWSESLQPYIANSLPRTSSGQVFWLAIMVKPEPSICMAPLITYPPPLAELIPIGSAAMAILLRLSLPSGFPAITWSAILRVVIWLVTPRIAMGSRTRKQRASRYFCVSRTTGALAFVLETVSALRVKRRLARRRTDNRRSLGILGMPSKRVCDCSYADWRAAHRSYHERALTWSYSRVTGK